MPTQYEVKTALSDYLQSFNWDYFFTITYKSKYRNWNKPDYAQRRVWEKLVYDSTIFAPDRMFIVSEPHQMGHFHHHGLIKYPFVPLQEELERSMVRHCGWSDFDRILDNGRVSDYCAKYIIRNNNLFDYDFLGRAANWKT